LNNCTNQQVFDVAINGIKPNKGQVIILVIQNILCDAVKGIDKPEMMNAALKSTISNYLRQLKDVAEMNPVVKFALVKPNSYQYIPCTQIAMRPFANELGKELQP
jgi:hypothetical protein